MKYLQESEEGGKKIGRWKIAIQAGATSGKQNCNLAGRFDVLNTVTPKRNLSRPLREF